MKKNEIVTKLADWLTKKILMSSPRIIGRHPSKTYHSLKRTIGREVSHPRELFLVDPQQLRAGARKAVETQKNWAAARGLWAALPPGLNLAGMVVDFSEYVRHVFILTQEIGHIYGLIPDPTSATFEKSLHEYYSNEFERILAFAMWGFGVKSPSVDYLSCSLGKESAPAAIPKQSESQETGLFERLVHRGSEKARLRGEISLAKETVIKGLVEQLVKTMFKEAADETVETVVKFAVPGIGGAIGVASNYVDMHVVGNRLTNMMEEEHLRIRPEVLLYWKKESSPVRRFFKLFARKDNRMKG